MAEFFQNLFSQDWIPAITVGIFVLFGTGIWNLIKKGFSFLKTSFTKVAPAIDEQTEKFMGDENSDEFWRQLKDLADSMSNMCDRMILRDSFRNEKEKDPEPVGTVTDLSNRFKKLGE